MFLGRIAICRWTTLYINVNRKFLLLSRSDQLSSSIVCATLLQGRVSYSVGVS